MLLRTLLLKRQQKIGSHKVFFDAFLSHESLQIPPDIKSGARNNVS